MQHLDFLTRLSNLLPSFVYKQMISPFNRTFTTDHLSHLRKKNNNHYNNDNNDNDIRYCSSFRTINDRGIAEKKPELRCNLRNKEFCLSLALKNSLSIKVSQSLYRLIYPGQKKDGRNGPEKEEFLLPYGLQVRPLRRESPFTAEKKYLQKKSLHDVHVRRARGLSRKKDSQEVYPIKKCFVHILRFCIK